MADKPLECVLDVGAALVNLRHYLEKAEPLYDAVDKAMTASEPEMKKHGWKKMQYATCRRKVLEARAAPFLIMEGHDSLRKNLAPCGLAEPTDADLVDRVGLANFR